MDNPWNGGWGLRPEEVAKLTDRQIFTIYLRPRREDGRPVSKTPEPPEFEREPTDEEIRMEYDRLSAMVIEMAPAGQREAKKKELADKWQEWLKKREAQRRGT